MSVPLPKPHSVLAVVDLYYHKTTGNVELFTTGRRQSHKLLHAMERYITTELTQTQRQEFAKKSEYDQWTDFLELKNIKYNLTVLDG